MAIHGIIGEFVQPEKSQHATTKTKTTEFHQKLPDSKQGILDRSCGFGELVHASGAFVRLHVKIFLSLSGLFQAGIDHVGTLDCL